MSGIVGIYHLDGRPVQPDELDRMVATIAHRGQDGSGVWQAGSVGLGHCMLWTTPESLHEKIPFANDRDDLVFTADARIDNRAELLSALALDGYPGRVITDGQLILKAYEKWGQDCPGKLVGDFVFAIWDGRERTLFCARDHIGAKPFYYYRSERLFIFASEIKALFTNEWVPRRLNELRVADHLAFFVEDKTITYYQDIYRLPPAHSMLVNPSAVEIRAYWSLDPSREIKLKSDEEYAEAFRDVFSQAVNCRLRSAYPIGSTLSGGLDSSSIACLARDLLVENGGQSLHTFSAIFPSLPPEDLRRIDERSYMDAVLAMGGFEPHFIHADCLSPLEDLDRVFWHQDEAVFAPNLYLHWAIFQLAQQQGVRVILDGVDGDTVISHGLERLADLARTGRWKSLLSEAIALSDQPGVSASPRKIIGRFGFGPLVPQPAVDIWRSVRGEQLSIWPPFSVVDPGFAYRIGLDQHIKALAGEDNHPLRSARYEHWYSLNSGLLPPMLEILDKVSAAFSLETRYPYFDRRLMEFCLALPSDQKLSSGWTRIVQRRAMQGILPEEVRWRFAKAELGPNLVRQLLNYETETLEEVILHNPGVVEPYVDLPALQSVYQRFRAQAVKEDSDAMVVYAVAVLSRWLQQVNFVL
jgi:asparagine synthase (glutamine-hydrolysing)